MNRTAKGKTRISIAVTNEQLARIDEICKRIGFSRSATAAFLLTQAMESYEMFLGLPSEKMKVFVQALKEAEADQAV